MFYVPEPPKINGLKGSFKQPGTWGRDGSGYFWEYNFEGTAAEVDMDAGIVNANGAQFTVTELHGGRKHLAARFAWPFGQGEQPENVWELDPNEVEKELLEADFPFGSIGLISKVNREKVTEALNANIHAEDAAFIDDGSFFNALSALYLMKAGVRSFPVEASVIRHTQIVSNQWTVKASFFNVGRILSTASMYSLEDVPNTLLFDVPTTPTPAQFIEDSGDLQYGWRKIRPRITRQNYTKWQIINVWQFGLWAVKMYGNVL